MESPLKRQQSLPVLYAKGTYYEVGYNVGRTFIGLIKTLVETHPSLNNEYIPIYNTEEGKTLYHETLKNVANYYPLYLRELQGISDGSQVPFYKLFLLHIDDVLPECLGKVNDSNEGCSTVILNKKTCEMIGHTEDALKEVLNNVYILNAQYTESPSQEHITAFCYAGLLPGYAMGYNRHGLVFSINVIKAKYLGRGKLPRTFVTRALLAVNSFESVIKTLECDGIGIADAMSVNLSFLNKTGTRIFYNIEVSPSYPESNKSALSVIEIATGDVLFHTNKFLHLKIPEQQGLSMVSSNARHETGEKYEINDANSVHDLLSDTSNSVCGVFRSSGRGLTVAVAFFDFIKRTWSIYVDNPKNSDPIGVFPLDIS